MSLQQQLEEHLATSMKEGQVERTTVLRLIKNGLQQEQIRAGHELNEDEQLKVLQREAKQRKDSITQYRDNGREELAVSEEAELAIIEEFLPDQMSEDDLGKLVDSVISETNADKSQMGMVIGQVLKRAEGRADGSAVSAMVRQKLV